MNKEFYEEFSDVQRGLFTILYNAINGGLPPENHEFIHLRSLTIEAYDIIYEYSDGAGKIHHYTYNFFDDSIKAFYENSN